MLLFLEESAVIPTVILEYLENRSRYLRSIKNNLPQISCWKQSCFSHDIGALRGIDITTCLLFFRSVSAMMAFYVFICIINFQIMACGASFFRVSITSHPLFYVCASLVIRTPNVARVLPTCTTRWYCMY